MSGGTRIGVFAGVVAVVVAAVIAARLLLAPAPHNVVIFVADGLRYGVVTDETAPEMTRVRREGVDFANSHALYPTVTTANASAIATGHMLGDTGDFANSAWVGAPALKEAFLSLTPFYEDDAVLGGMNARFGGDYLGETSLLAAARQAGFSTAAVGKVGPSAIQDVTSRDGRGTIVIDDQTGQPEGLPLAPEVAAAMTRAGLGTFAADRGLNGYPGTYNAPGVNRPNDQQQDWFARVATEVVLPRFKAAKKPFVLVFWSRDPDGTQHNQGDSLNTLTPGINGATTFKAIRNADDDLGRLRAALKRLGLDRTTDIVVTADHGFSTISKQSATSPAARRSYADVPQGFLPPGFLGLDLARALSLPLYDPNGLPVDVEHGFHPGHSNAILGRDPKAPDLAIGANGGSDLIWLPTAAGRAMAPRIVEALTRQDYVAAIFVDDALGRIPGALPLSAIGHVGAARTPRPAIVVSFRSWTTGCARPETCVVEVADGDLQQGQGNHGSLSRADTHNMMAAWGPDFRRAYADPLPVGNADWAPTLAHLLKLDLHPRGKLTGRVMAEALARGGAGPKAAMHIERSTAAANGFTTVLDVQTADGRRYYDAGGAVGRTFGLRP